MAPVIPHIIHQIWLSPDGAESEAPSDIQINMAAWDRTHPGFVRQVWSQPKLRGALTDFHNLPVLEAMDACALFAMKADIARLALIYDHGGIWSDLKNRPVKPFLAEFTDKAPLLLSEHSLREGADLPFNNAFFGAAPRHPFILAVLQDVLENVTNRRHGNVTNITGHGVLQAVLRRQLHAGMAVPFVRLTLDETWAGSRLRRTSASYNAGGHWSKEQKVRLYHSAEDLC